MTDRQLEAFVTGIVTVMKEEFTKLETRIAALEHPPQMSDIITGVGTVSDDALTALRRRIAALEQRTLAAEMTRAVYRGSWEPERTYGLNDQVSHHGLLWTATADAPGEPGMDYAWTMDATRRPA